MQYDLFQNRILLHVMGELRERHRQWADTEKKKISVDEVIKTVGEYKVTVKLFPEISSVIKVIVEG